MKRRLAGLTVGAALIVAGLGVFAAPTAQALGPEGCAAQGANGILAVGTVTGTAAPAPPSGGGLTATCTYTALSSAGGWAGGDQVSWSVTVDTPHASATDNTGMPCGWVANATTGISTASGKGTANGGVGCIKSGGAGTGTAG